MNVHPNDSGNVPEFDAAVLVDLVDSNPAEFKKFALMFLDSFEAALANLDSALANDDRAGLGAVGHRAKTTARNIGAMALGRKCELLESLVQASYFDEARRVAIGVRTLFEGVRSALLRCVNSLQSGL